VKRPYSLCIVPLAAALVAIPPAFARDRDGRITTRLFDASTIVSLHGRVGIQSTVAFAPEEHIENIAVGNSEAWQVTPNKRADLLFLKPTAASARTNMTVITDQHTYLFDLVSAPGIAPVYMLRFTYPVPPRPLANPAVTPASGSPPPVVAVAPALASTPDPAALNFAWDVRGDKALLPSRLFDDGRRIYLAWPKDGGLPAILTHAPDGAEGPVNYRVRGDFVVVDGVPSPLVLRLGKRMATLTQLHPIAQAAASPAPPTQSSIAAPHASSVDAAAYVRTASAKP
jgi:type IV secretion system protein VirB9